MYEVDSSTVSSAFLPYFIGYQVNNCVGTTPADLFANQLVRATLKAHPARRLYIGAGAQAMAWLALLLPQSVLVCTHHI
jgi:hypothetical protein